MHLNAWKSHRRLSNSPCRVAGRLRSQTVLPLGRYSPSASGNDRPRAHDDHRRLDDYASCRHGRRTAGRDVTWGGKPLVNQSIVWAARQDTSALNTFNWLPADVIIDRVDTDQDGRFVLDIPSVRGTYLLVVDTAQFTYFQPVQFAVGR